MCKCVSLEITDIRQTMVKYPAAVYKCRTMRHYFSGEPLVCASLRRSAAARLITALVKTIIRCACGRDADDVNHLAQSGTCWRNTWRIIRSRWLAKKKKKNNIKVMQKSALRRSGKLHNLHIIRIFSLHCSSSGSKSKTRVVVAPAFRRVAHLTHLLL